MNDDDIEIGDNIREYVINHLVEPYYKEAIKGTINGKKIWRIVGISLETISKILVAAGGIVSFSAGYYHDDTLSFVSGSISCMSLAMLQLSSFSYKENKKQSQELNTLLKKLNLDTVPVLDRQTQQSCMQSQIQSSQYPHVPTHHYPIQDPIQDPLSLFGQVPHHPLNTYPKSNLTNEYTFNSDSNQTTNPIWKPVPEQYMTQKLNNNNNNNSIPYNNNPQKNKIVRFATSDHHNSISSSNTSSDPETPPSNLREFYVSPFHSESSESSETSESSEKNYTSIR